MNDLTDKEDKELDALLSGGLFALTIGLALVGAIFLLNLG